MAIVRIKLRRGTAAEWSATDPVLESGEPGYESDTGVYKIGDGVTAWTALVGFSGVTEGNGITVTDGEVAIDTAVVETVDNKGQPLGYASLDGDGKVFAAQLPAGPVDLDEFDIDSDSTSRTNTDGTTVGDVLNDFDTILSAKANTDDVPDPNLVAMGGMDAVTVDANKSLSDTKAVHRLLMQTDANITLPAVNSKGDSLLVLIIQDNPGGQPTFVPAGGETIAWQTLDSNPPEIEGTVGALTILSFIPEPQNGRWLGIVADSIPAKLIEAKGDSIWGTGDNSVARLAAGSNGQGIIYDSGQTAGVKPVSMERILRIILDGGGEVLTTGGKNVHLPIPVDCTITKVRALSLNGTSGSIEVDLWVDTYANFPPTDADSITGGNEVTISAATKSEDSTLTSWTTNIAAGSYIEANIDSVTSLTKVAIDIYVRPR